MIIKDNKGVILIASYMVITVLTILGTVFISRSISEMRTAQHDQATIQAFYLAEAGVDYALSRLRIGNSSGDPSALPLRDSSGQIIGTYDCKWGRIENSSRWEIVSTGAASDSEREIRVELQPDTFARYLYFTNDEHFRSGWLRVPVWFITRDNLAGPLQTNGHFHISGNPTFSDLNFHKPVKSEDDFITYMNGGRPINSQASSNPPYDLPDFQEGLQLDAEQAPFPSKALDLRTAAVQNGYHLTGPTTIVLKNDGTIDVTNPQKGWANKNMALPPNGTLFVEGGDLTISGTLKGELSVGTNRNIIIANSIKYNTDPRTDPSSTDTLGLIAEKNVIIYRNAPYDVEVNASIMALGDSFTVEQWWQTPAKGTLTVYGGIIQDERGPVGTFNPSTNTKVSGYTKDYQYDPRLMDSPPPFYPTTGDYVIVSWSEVKEGQ